MSSAPDMESGQIFFGHTRDCLRAEALRGRIRWQWSRGHSLMASLSGYPGGKGMRVRYLQLFSEFLRYPADLRGDYIYRVEGGQARRGAVFS